jgi:hypothetical protein
VADEETLAVLLDLVTRAESVAPLADKLRFLGLTDAVRSPVARRFLDRIESGSWLVSQGFRGLVDEPLELPEALASNEPVLEIMSARAQRMNRLALNCATRKDRGEDITADEAAIVEMLELDYPYGGGGGYHDYVQWGYFHAQTLGLRSDRLARSALRHIRTEFPMGEAFSTHADAARAFLEASDLSVALQVEVERQIRYRAPEPGPRGVNIVHPLHGGRSTGIVSVQRTPAIRKAVYGGNVWAIDELSRCTRLIDRDLDYLEAALARAPAWTRLWLLTVIERDALDVPRVREAVRGRLADVDDEVRRRAQDLIDSAGW